MYFIVDLKRKKKYIFKTSWQNKTIFTLVSTKKILLHINLKNVSIQTHIFWSFLVNHMFSLGFNNLRDYTYKFSWKSTWNQFESKRIIISLFLSITPSVLMYKFYFSKYLQKHIFNSVTLTALANFMSILFCKN